MTEIRVASEATLKLSQKGNQSISIAGNHAYRIEPAVNDFYKRLLELRQEVKGQLKHASAEERLSLNPDQLAIKILAMVDSNGGSVTVWCGSFCVTTVS